MSDPYLYENFSVLRNKLGITEEKTLDLVEAEQSRANMMLLYEREFTDFSPAGLCRIHRFLFDDIYDWAGEYRVINIQKAERLLGGRSVWYSNAESIEDDLNKVFAEIHEYPWNRCSRRVFVDGLVRFFPRIWRIHPFREGNTRTVVMLMTLFVEAHGYYFDKELLAASAGYVRDSFVMAALDRNSEYDHLRKILLDAVCREPVPVEEFTAENGEPQRYQKYQREPYKPTPHTAYDGQDYSLDQDQDTGEGFAPTL